MKNKDSALVSSALAALDADGLRAVVREILPWLDESVRARLVNALIDRAARGGSGWVPSSPSARFVSEVQTFAEAAIRTGQADPEDVDQYLRQGVHAFLAKDYDGACAIFRALLLPVGNGEIYLGQHEMLDEVLGVDLADCAAQYVVAIYMTSAPAKRATAVLAALDDARAEGHFWTPIREIERVAVEPLPGLSDFLPQWRALAAARASKERKDEWEGDADRWLSEVTQRLEGTEGLARLARKTRRAHDLRAWCKVLLDARDWSGALRACEEAARLSSDDVVRAELLDGAALATQQLNRNDLPALLERAWRAAPTLVRLCRWLDASTSRRVLSHRAAIGLKACPKKAHCQRALLFTLCGDFESAARLLAAAPGLGWSHEEHPGHVAFWLLARLLAPKGTLLPVDRPTLAFDGLEESAGSELDGDSEGPSSGAAPRLPIPDLGEIVALAAIDPPKAEPARTTLLKSLRRAAEKRAVGVTGEKRRRHYSHAARLVAACATVDATPETIAWVASVRAVYRRFPAMQAEFDRCFGR